MIDIIFWIFTVYYVNVIVHFMYGYVETLTDMLMCVCPLGLWVYFIGHLFKKWGSVWKM